MLVYLLDDFYRTWHRRPARRRRRAGQARAGLLRRAAAILAHDADENATARWHWCATAPCCARRPELDEGTKAIDEAVQVLGRDAPAGRPVGDHRRRTLALGLSTRARLASSTELEGQALSISGQVIEAIKPLATVPNATVRAAGADSEALIMQGYLQMTNNKYEDAIATLEESRSTLRSIDGLRINDLAAAAAWAEATSWQVQSLTSMGRNEEAKRAAWKAAVANNAKNKPPYQPLPEKKNWSGIKTRSTIVAAPSTTTTSSVSSTPRSKSCT